jgi:type IV secretion system protein VirB10
MSNKFLNHDADTPQGQSATLDIVSNSRELPSDANDERDTEDINAIAEANQRKFPLAALLIACVVTFGLLVVVGYYVKNLVSSIAEPETPAATLFPDPLASSKGIAISEIPPHFDNQSTPEASLGTGTVPAPGTPTNQQAGQAGSTCPHVPITDPLGNPVLGANGMPAMKDCQGRIVRSPEIVPTAQGAAGTSGATTGSTSASSAAASTVSDRYRGQVVLSKDGTTNARASLADAPASLGSLSAAEATLAALQSQMAPPMPLAQSIAPPLANQSQQNTPVASPRSGAQGRNIAIRTIDENLVIPKGHSADCALTMRAVTETNGFAECIITAHVYSANGRTLLIERFSKALGEYNVNSAAGQRVIPILWTSIRKPGGITIELSAPAVDGLGGAGLPATVDNRWGERIGGAYLLSVVKDVIAYKTAKDAAGAASAQVYQNTTQASNDIVEKILSTTIGIRPTLYANQGDRALILFNRDVDFSGVYDVQRRK